MNLNLPGVIRWCSQIPTNSFFLSVLTFGEICKGVEKIKEFRRKEKLLIWLEHELYSMFKHRILPITIEVADCWGRLQHQMARTLPAIDGLIANCIAS